MGNKDDIWYENKVDEIRKKKRKLRHIQDAKKVKQIKEDLKREQRAAKRSMKSNLKNWIKDQINDETIP
jgi:hypothetical protein